MDYRVKPWLHQLTAIERAKTLRWFALFFGVGTGKTCAAINILRHKMASHGRYFRTLVLAPPIMLPKWKEQFEMHSKINPNAVVVLDGSGTKRLKTFMEHAYDKEGNPQGAFFVTNYEALLMDDLLESFLSWSLEAFVLDESQRVKNYRTARSKRADLLANPKGKPKPLTYILSGTPILNSPMDVFHQFKIMDGGATFGRNFFIFRARYFEDKNAGMLKSKNTQGRYFPDWRVRPGALEEINRLIFTAGMRVTKEECLDLPEELSVTIKCGMTAAQAKNYKEMKQDFITFVANKSASATLAIVKALRLMQITSGYLPLHSQGEEAPAKVVYEKTPKEEALRELLEEITPSSKVVVWAVWKANYGVIRRACEDLKLEYVEINGDVSSAKQNEAVERFEKDPLVKVLIGHPGSGGVGIDLIAAAYSIFYSRNFSLEHWLQARARNHRGGQTKKVTHYDLVVEDTIDQLVSEKLALKLDMSEKILTDISLAIKEQAN